MSSIETLLRRRLLVPAPSLLPVSGLGKLAVLGQREGQAGRWPRGRRGKPLSRSTCSLAQRLRLSDGARFRRCVSCMDVTLIPSGEPNTCSIGASGTRQDGYKFA
ncbi:hypothetical protein J3F84DRAFT_33581 [Trichoderma pleuroticola]